LLAHDFIRNALLAGTPIALACGAVGYFVVLRSQVFAGDALSHVAFTGALAAAAAGVDLRLGLFASTVFVAALLAAIGERTRIDDVTIGIVFVWVLGLGVFFLDLFNRGVNGGNGIVASRTLFGSIFALTTPEARVAALIGICVVLVVLAIARPLLYATVDPQVAAARGVPVALLGAALLILLGIDAAVATQAVGALLLLGLIAAPAGAAIKLAAQPYRALALSSLFAVASIWLGVVAAYVISSLPPSTAILGVAALIYAGSFVISFARRQSRRAPRSAIPRHMSLGRSEPE
jgi:zinc/manganese transport system permease protein